MNAAWTPGNRVRLLENGEAFFPAAFEAIRQARREILLETFILWDDKVGKALQAALLEAAGRGVQIDMMVDGFGSCDLTPAFITPLNDAGVRLRVFDPFARFLRHVMVLRRMHRKILVIDGERAFVGGINYSADHLADYGPEAKQDYAIEIEGPIVDRIRDFAVSAIVSAPGRQPPARTARAAAPARGSVEAMFVTRDNHRHPTDIERQYRIAIRAATRRVVIANAYFFPGYRLLRELRRAARRGVVVQLILQGEPDMPIVKTAAMLLYDHLQRDGVEIHEYCKRPLHGKVAVVDDDWSTVGSSNLDPLSLSLNLEANVVLRDPAFAADLHERLQQLIANDCSRAASPPPSRWSLWPQLRSAIVFHVLRRFPAWARLLPRHAPRLVLPELLGRAPTWPHVAQSAGVGGASASHAAAQVRPGG